MFKKILSVIIDASRNIWEWIRQAFSSTPQVEDLSASAIHERKSRIEQTISSLTEQNYCLREALQEAQEENKLLWDFLEEAEKNEVSMQKKAQEEAALLTYVESVKDVGEA